MPVGPAALFWLALLWRGVASAAPHTDPALVQAAWERHFGPMPDGALRTSAAGRVSMPFAQVYDGARIAQACQQEQLDTPLRREKAWVAEGPRLPGHAHPAWAHFLGSDPPDSDTWGDADFVAFLVDLSASWFAACAATAPDPAVCTVQLGDIAWPEPVTPDPLGHSDHLGRCVDIRLFRSDASRYEAWWNRADDRPAFAQGDQPGSANRRGYSVDLTAAFIAHARAAAPLGDLFFNDPAIVQPGLERRRGHDDHIHLCLPPVTAGQPGP